MAQTTTQTPTYFQALATELGTPNVFDAGYSIATWLQTTLKQMATSAQTVANNYLQNASEANTFANAWSKVNSTFVPQNAMEQKMLDLGRQIEQGYKNTATYNLGAAATPTEMAALAKSWAATAGGVVALAEMGTKWYEGDTWAIGNTSAGVLGGWGLAALVLGLAAMAGVAATSAIGIALAIGFGYFGAKAGNAVWDWLVPHDYNVNLNTAYRSAMTFVLRRDPLALDLDNDGLETTAITGTNPTLFDHDGDGVKTGTGWLKGDDAFLALDRNGNGSIDTGAELFGVDTVLANGQKAANGFAALADLDSNHDGKFSSLDTQFANVRVWRDLNQDGVSQAGELSTLASAGIASINLTSTATNIALTGGNVQTAAGSFTRTDGQTGNLGDFTTGSTGNLDLAQNPFYSDFTDPIPLTPAAQGIADMQGAGMVRDLRQAASLDGALVTQVNSFAGLTHAQMMSGLDGLLETWADTSAMKTSFEYAADVNLELYFRLPDMTVNDLRLILGIPAYETDPSTGQPRPVVLTPEGQALLEALRAEWTHANAIIGVLERFNGLPFVTFINDSDIARGWETFQESNRLAGITLVSVTVPLNAGQVQLLEQSYAQLKESVYAGLVMQTRLKPYLDAITLSINESGIVLDFSAMEAAMDACHATDPSKALIDRIDLVKYTGASLRDSGWAFMPKLSQWISEATADGTWDAVRASLGASYGAATSGDDFYVMDAATTSFDGGDGGLRFRLGNKARRPRCSMRRQWRKYCAAKHCAPRVPPTRSSSDQASPETPYSPEKSQEPCDGRGWRSRVFSPAAVASACP